MSEEGEQEMGCAEGILSLKFLFLIRCDTAQQVGVNSALKIGKRGATAPLE